MPKITINGKACEFTPGQMILQVANDHGIEIPQYCYHDALSIVASCRICLAEVHAPNPRNLDADGKPRVEPMPKLVPTCQTAASDGMEVYTDSPKSKANQKAVMEYLLINHPLDCPVCDQSGECFLQDYSYDYGRGVSRFEESKVKQPKKNLGPHVYLYADRCIMCSRCVRFTREITETAELTVNGRGNQEQIDIFPGVALDNELSANVIDLCPVGALLDKEFLFTQRVWFLKSTPSVDGITSSGDNIYIEHNNNKVYRVKPRENPHVNKHWITDEVRYGYAFVHDGSRVTVPMRRERGVQIDSDWNRALLDAVDGIRDAAGGLALLVSPMLTCEDAYALATTVREIDPGATVGVGPVPIDGQDKVFPPSAADDDPRRFVMRAEKAPNARGVRRVLAAVLGSAPAEYNDWISNIAGAGAVIVTGNYPSRWHDDRLASLVGDKFSIVIDTLGSELIETCDVFLPASTWVEKAGTFENAEHRLQAFEQAIYPIGRSKPEAQVALDLRAVFEGAGGPEDEDVVIAAGHAGQVLDAVTVLKPIGEMYNAADLRAKMASEHDPLRALLTETQLPKAEVMSEPDMQMVEL